MNKDNHESNDFFNADNTSSKILLVLIILCCLLFVAAAVIDVLMESAAEQGYTTKNAYATYVKLFYVWGVLFIFMHAVMYRYFHKNRRFIVMIEPLYIQSMLQKDEIGGITAIILRHRWFIKISFGVSVLMIWIGKRVFRDFFMILDMYLLFNMLLIILCEVVKITCIHKALNYGYIQVAEQEKSSLDNLINKCLLFIVACCLLMLYFDFS